MNKNVKHDIQWKPQETECSYYRFHAAAGAALQSFFLHALFLLSAYMMAQCVLAVEGLTWKHLLGVGGVLAALVILFEVLLPAGIHRLENRLEQTAVRICASVAVLYPAAGLFYRYYLHHQLDIEDGMLVLAERYTGVYNTYYGSSVQLEPGKEEYLVQAVAFALLIAVVVQYLLVQMTGLRACVLVFPAAVAAAEMWVGLTPDAGSVFLFSASCIYMFAGKNGCWKTGVAAAAVWSLAFGTVSLAGEGAAEGLLAKAPEYKVYQEQAEAAVKQLATVNLWGRREKVSNKKPEYSDTQILTITADRQTSGNLYLKTFVGTRYENGSWVEDDSAYADAARLSGVDTGQMNELLWNTVYRAEAAGSIRTSPGDVAYTIRYARNLQSYALFPYFGSVDGLGQVSYRGDQSLKVSMGTKEITVHALGANDLEHVVTALAADYRSDDDSETAWEWYSSFVQQQYLDAGDAVEAVYTLTEEKTGAYESASNLTRVHAAQEVAEFLETTYTYSWNLDTIADGTDAVEYFLTTGKKGYCMHFATAGTLMLRALGIPARYVEGYVVKEGAFSKNADGTYTASVLDRSAHAWTEIYLENIGWVPIEMTPGFSGDGTVLPTDKDVAKEREQQEKTDTKTNGDTQKKDDTSIDGNTESAVLNEDSEMSELYGTSEVSEMSEESPNRDDSDNTEQSDAPDSWGIFDFNGGAGQSGTDNTSGAAVAEGDGLWSVGWSENDDRTNESSTEGVQPLQTAGSNRLGTLLRCLARLLLFAAALACLFAFAVWLTKQIRTRIRAYHVYVDQEIARKHYRKAVRCINRRIWRRLRLRRRALRLSVTDREYEQLLAQTFQAISEKDWGRYMEIVKKTEFSADGPNESDAVFCQNIYHMVIARHESAVLPCQQRRKPPQ